MVPEVKKEAPKLSIADARAQLLRDIEAKIGDASAADVRSPLEQLRAKMGNKEETREALARAIKETTQSLPEGDARVAKLRANLTSLASALEASVAPAVAEASGTTEKKADTTKPVEPLVSIEKEGLKVNAPVVGPVLEQAKKVLPSWAQIPVIGGVLYTGVKGMSWLMKKLGFGALAKPIDYAAHVVGEVGLWSGAWSMLDHAVAKVNGKEVESH